MWGGVYGCEFFFFNDTATTEIYTLSLHDALPILQEMLQAFFAKADFEVIALELAGIAVLLEIILSLHSEIGRAHVNSSHANISYAVFCLKKKNIFLNYSTTLYPTYTLPSSHPHQV